MDWVRFDYPHSVSLAEAASRAAAAARTLCARCQLEMTTAKSRTDLSGKVLRGSIAAHRNKLSVSIMLIGAVTPTRASVAAEVRGALDRQFALSTKRGPHLAPPPGAAGGVG